MAARFLKKLVPLSFKQWAKNPQNGFQIACLRLAQGSRTLSAFYYLLANGAFRREMNAVVRGKLAYRKANEEVTNRNYMLRRNTHRLEKGLIMRPRRSVFARDYIGETVNAFEKLAQNADAGTKATPEFAWYRDVLERYFDVTGSDPVLDPLRERFGKLDLEGANGVHRSPYHRDLDDHPVSPEAMWKLARRRRSTRWYLDKPVPRALVDQAIQIAAQSPSACNRQPFEFRIFDDPKLVQEIAGIPFGTTGFNQQFPMIAVVVGQLDAYFSERDRHVIYIDSGLASMAFLFALETVGLSSCPINWPDVEEQERKMDQALGLQPHERPVMLISIGYPDPEGMVPYSEKKSLEEIRSYNRAAD